MHHRIRQLSIVLALGLAGPAAAATLADQRAWVQDFDELLDEMAVGYANLEWAAERYELDLQELADDTRRRLLLATSERRARREIAHFLEHFADPHLVAEPVGITSPPLGSTPRQLPHIDRYTESNVVLRLFGYEGRDPHWELDFHRMAGFRSLAGDPFPTGIIPLEDGRRLGVLRIAFFGEDRYEEEAEIAWDAYRPQIEGSCEVDCLLAFEADYRRHLIGVMAYRVEALVAEGIDALMIDVTGNGGGTEWSGQVAQAFASTPLTCLENGYVRNAHWTTQLQRRMGHIDQDLAREDLDPAVRELLVQGQSQLSEVIHETTRDCDTAAIWRGEAPACPAVVRDAHVSCLDPGAVDRDLLRELDSYSVLFSEYGYERETPIYAGPLFVAIDEGTASSAEFFASLMQSNAQATIVGATSYGAGCGYTGPGIASFLESLDLKVAMPDCVRFRGDGSNELAGIEPDLVVDWAYSDGDRRKAYALVDALSDELAVRGISPAGTDDD